MIQPMDHVEPDPTKSYTIKTAMHVPYSWSYFIKCCYSDNLSVHRLYRGENCVKKFVESITQDVTEIGQNYLPINEPIHPLTDEEQSAYEQATHCFICEKVFDENNLNLGKVKDHSHSTGQYRGPAHSICNLSFKPKKYIPCFFHNLTNYDSHLFIKELAKTRGNISVIAQNKEKYISFSKQVYININGESSYITMRFLDSFRFMASSLDTLAQNLDDSQCRTLSNYFPNPKQFSLMRRKGVFPYSHVDSFEKLSEDKLPTYDQFYDRFRGENISEKDYARAEEVWREFKCTKLGDYSDLYLLSDVLLLTDVFESFRDVCLNIYGLDPANYITASALAWDSMLKYTQVELELLTHIDMVHFIKNSIRGGINEWLSASDYKSQPTASLHPDSCSGMDL